jgi:hypothetical protein
MNPAVLALLVELVKLGVEEYPHLAADFREIFSNENPTPEDWAALRAKVKGQSFESLAPHAKLN